MADNAVSCRAAGSRRDKAPHAGTAAAVALAISSKSWYYGEPVARARLLERTGGQIGGGSRGVSHAPAAAVPRCQATASASVTSERYCGGDCAGNGKTSGGWASRRFRAGVTNAAPGSEAYAASTAARALGCTVLASIVPPALAAASAARACAAGRTSRRLTSLSLSKPPSCWSAAAAPSCRAGVADRSSTTAQGRGTAARTWALTAASRQSALSAESGQASRRCNIRENDWSAGRQPRAATLANGAGFLQEKRRRRNKECPEFMASRFPRTLGPSQPGVNRMVSTSLGCLTRRIRHSWPRRHPRRRTCSVPRSFTPIPLHRIRTLAGSRDRQRGRQAASAQPLPEATAGSIAADKPDRPSRSAQRSRSSAAGVLGHRGHGCAVLPGGTRCCLRARPEPCRPSFCARVCG